MPAYPGDMGSRPPRVAPHAVRPGAVVAVAVLPGRAACLPRMLDALAAAIGPADLPIAAGGLAVLVLSTEPEVVAPILRDRESDFPHPLRLHATAEAPDDHACVRLAARVARMLGVAEAPVFLLDVRRPPAPDWLYWAAAALRDGEAVVRARCGLASWLGFGPAAPRGVAGGARDLFRPGHSSPLLRPRHRPAVV
ncbi:hypothetical protein ACE7GA_10875 [Roseomonas sp. CCTCC AB2023176]|uniref:hypothetical protein n=1 Tax=Roseomonas sp. CCTCC AB2023176 TaxID=3342640 RepID=UPI0035E28FD3